MQTPILLSAQISRREMTLCARIFSRVPGCCGARQAIRSRDIKAFRGASLRHQPLVVAGRDYERTVALTHGGQFEQGRIIPVDIVEKCQYGVGDCSTGHGSHTGPGIRGITGPTTRVDDAADCSAGSHQAGVYLPFKHTCDVSGSTRFL